MLSYTIISGEIKGLQVGTTNIHYLDSISKNQSLAAGVAITQAALGQAGSVLSAQAATDEGDPVENFVMYVGNMPVIGSFWKVTFTNGDYVEVVGKEINGAFKAVAIVNREKNIIWIQPHCERGTSARRRRLIKQSLLFSLFILFLAFPLHYFSGVPLYFCLITSSASIPIILLFTFGFSWKDFMAFSGEMNKVGGTLNISNPEEIDLFKTTQEACRNGKQDLPIGVYYLPRS